MLPPRSLLKLGSLPSTLSPRIGAPLENTVSTSGSRPANPGEKGIDVALAIDFVATAVRGEYDVGVIVSTDTDLKPALEAVAGLGGNPYPRAEVAAWSTQAQHSHRLSIPGRRLWCHRLDEHDYQSVADPTDYTQP
jgi:hypothetical protein